MTLKEQIEKIIVTEIQNCALWSENEYDEQSKGFFEVDGAVPVSQIAEKIIELCSAEVDYLLRYSRG